MTSIDSPVVLVGVGEMGGVFARALLKAGYPVVPVTREIPIGEVADRVREPEVVLVTVGEDDLSEVLASLPHTWKSRVALIQNELLPRDWKRHDIEQPTVAVVWFEKKPGIDTNVLIPTPVAGPNAWLFVDALTGLGIAANEIPSEDIENELIAKNLYILVANIAGLETGGTVHQLWSEHEDLAMRVGGEVLLIQEWLVGHAIDADAAFARMLEAFAGDPNHGTTGRSAPRRLARAIGHAHDAGIEVPVLTDIARAHDISF